MAVAAPTTLGKYRLIAELGQGGMADVYLAMVAGPTGSGFTKLAVIKRLRPNLVEDPEFVAMLVDEARISARLNHPNVVQTLEVGFEHEEYYLALEFLDGQPLHRVQRRATRSGTPFPRELACLVVADVLSGLHHAHELADYDGSPLGVVHRDVNPQNVFVTYDGAVKVVDFGIAKAAGRVAETKIGVVKGKIRYMSPEQAHGTDIDRRSDVFAAGLLLWEAATGRRFWGEANDLDIIQALVGGDFDPSPRSVDPTVPALLDAICCKALASSPDARYATTGELRDDLEGYLSESAVNARRRLGAFVAGMFEKERANVRAVIERASRFNHEAPSMAVLLGASQTARTLDPPSGSGSAVSMSGIPGPTHASIAPVHMDPRSGEHAAPKRPAARPRLATFLALGVIMASSVVVVVEMKHRREGVSGVASASPAPRQVGEVASAHTGVVLRSAAEKLSRTTPAAVAPRVGEPMRAAPQRASAPPPSAAPGIEAPPAASPARIDPHRRSKATIDTGDPWTKQEEGAK